jgi:phenylalanyl-tRNA synthetase beta chain
MKVPLSWLKEFVDVPVDAAKLGEDLTLVGLALEGLEAIGGDTVLDLDITTNRVDCMNVYGVAREAAVIYGLPLKPLEVGLREAGPPAAEALAVSIEAPDLCPRFCARVLDVRLGPSPEWLRRRLEAVGVRSINNVVDLTNYVMMEVGQPSHAFDLARIPEGRLHIRWAREGEGLVTLDGVARTLSGQVGVVSGPRAPLGLAGIMGGASSEVSAETRTVALEAAYWEPRAIRRAARALGMHTEASHRFERGADPEGPVVGTARIAHLLEKIGAGTARPGLIDQVPAPRPRRRTLLRSSSMATLLGTEVPEERARAILRGLGFEIAGREGEGIIVEIPTWRGDVGREADVIEEVGRHYGLQKIPSTLPAGAGLGGLGPGQGRERAIRRALAGAGLTEVINYGFVGQGAIPPGPRPPVALANPLADGQGVLRTSLAVPGLLTNLETNQRQGRHDLRLFELGRIFQPNHALPVEEQRLAVLLTGEARPRHWGERPPAGEKPRAVDFFDLKGLLEGLFQRLGLEAPVLAADVERPPFLHPGKSAIVRWRGGDLGFLGALSPGLRNTREEVLLAEISLDGVLGAEVGPVRFQPLPRFPGVTRDLSLLCPEGLAAAEIEARIRRAGGGLLREAQVVDRYQSPTFPPGYVSLTVSLRYQHPERTLTSEEVQASVEDVIRELRSAGAEIRGE